MPWIEWIAEAEATGRLRELYDKYAGRFGIDHILKIHSLNPDSLEHHYSLYAHLMRGQSNLSLAEREMIAVVVSVANDCFYWIHHHGAGLRRLLRDEEKAAAIVGDYRSASLSGRERAICDYAVRLTTSLPAIASTDLRPLREAGLGDDEILDTCQVAAYYNFVNRLASGLGVEIEGYWQQRNADPV